MRQRLELLRAFARGAGLFVIGVVFLVAVMLLVGKAVDTDARGRRIPCRPGYVRISAASGYVCIPGYIPGSL